MLRSLISQSYIATMDFVSWQDTAEQNWYKSTVAVTFCVVRTPMLLPQEKSSLLLKDKRKNMLKSSTTKKMVRSGSEKKKPTEVKKS